MQSFPVLHIVYVPLDMNFGSRLKKCRIAADLTQEAVGAAFSTDEKPEGFIKATISAWELGRNEPSASQIVKLCQLYGVTADYLLFGKQSELEPNESWLLGAYRNAGDVGKQIIEHAATASLILGRTNGDDIAILPAKIAK